MNTPLIQNNSNSIWGVVMLKLSVMCILFLASLNASAVVNCTSGCGDIRTTISDTLTMAQNNLGETVNSDAVAAPDADVVYTTNGYIMQWLKYKGDPTPDAHAWKNTWQYHKVDDYISVAMSRTSPCVGNTGVIYAPYNVNIYTGGVDAPCSKREVTNAPDTGTLFSQRYQTSIRIDKKIVSGTYSKNILVGIAGYCQPDSCVTGQFTRNIYLDLNIVAPQSCEINAGQVINVNFGNISTGAFKTAGAKAQGVQAISKTVNISCENIAGNSDLTMRVLADKVDNTIIVSDENDDVGFRVLNTSGQALLPNSLTSVIPFTLNNNGSQDVTFQVVPVSVTGNTPTEGQVTSRAYLRVDFP